MPYNPEIHHRKSIRKAGHDYRDPGLYFVTICTRNREHDFGEIVNGAMELSAAGHIVRRAWRATPKIRPYVVLDAFIVMPNHIHGIIAMRRPTQSPGPVGIDGHQSLHRYGPQSKNLFAVIRGFKGTASKRINALHGVERGTIWQVRFHDRIIRNSVELERIRWYIRNNPRMWDRDRNNTS